MEAYINTAVSGLIFVWMIRIERKVAEVATTCRTINGGCDDKWSGADRRKKQGA